MAIAKATVGTDIWDTVRGYVNHVSVTNNAKLVSAYAKSYTKDASNKDFVVLHKPSINEDILTMTKREYPMTMDIEIVTSEEEQLKVISDAVRARLETNRNDAKENALFFMRITSDTMAYETRDNVRILHNIMTVSGIWRGGA